MANPFELKSEEEQAFAARARLRGLSFPLSRMTTRRWMIAVALAAILTTTGLAWHRRAYYRQQAAMHFQMERKSKAVALALRPRPRTARVTDVTGAVNLGLAVIERDKNDPRRLQAVGVSADPISLARYDRFPDVERRVRQAEAEFRQSSALLESLRKKAEDQAVYHRRLRQKYDQAANQPLLPIAPDPLPP
jgi:hypothetical protein